MKSGGWGSSANSECQYDVSCEEVEGWENEASSVVYIYMEYDVDRNMDGLTERYPMNGTGVFLNKVGDYAETGNPLVLTAGHLYCSTLADGSTVDIVNSIAIFRLYTAYENSECNEVNINRGVKLPGNFSRIYLGSDFNVLPTESGYSACMDYAILEATTTAEDLSYYDVEFAGWSTNYNLNNSSNTGYTCIHHPGGDVKKINKDNHYAYDVFSGDFNLYFDLGVSESGTSGAPIFNISRQVVGWAAGSSNLAGCEYVGQVTSKNKTVCGSFDVAYLYFYNVLDPNLTGEATSSNPQPPSPEELPDHCSDCFPNYDETGLDCGGSCFPCGIHSVVHAKTDLDLMGVVKSRYEIFAEPDPGTLLALKSGFSILEAGMNIHLNSGFEVQKGVTFSAEINQELMTEPERGCQDACISYPNIFTPNGDGINDYFNIMMAFVDSYDLLLWDYGSNIYVNVVNQPVYGNYPIMVWDGAGVSTARDIYGVLTYTDCYGDTHSEELSIYLSSPKSATISSSGEPLRNGSENYRSAELLINNSENNSAEINVYPNPVLDQVVINYNGKTFPLEYRIYDMDGKEVLHGNATTSEEVISMSAFPAGTYIVNAKARECNLVQKLIKK